MKGRVALVTGASRGTSPGQPPSLWRARARMSSAWRAPPAGLEETDDAVQKAGGSATLVPLNIRDFDALDRLGRSIFDRWGKLDAFLGNAGSLGVLTPLSHLEPKVFQELIEVNVTANWRLIRSLDPLLRQSDAGRVLFVSSGAARKHTAFWGGYGMAKAALESLALTYCGRVQRHERQGEPPQSGCDADRDARARHARRRPGRAAQA